MAYHGERWTVHDVASVFRTYLTQMPVRVFSTHILRDLPMTTLQESVIPHGMYHDVSARPLAVFSLCLRFYLKFRSALCERGVAI